MRWEEPKRVINLKDDTSKGGTDKSPAKRVRTEELGLPVELPDLLW